MYRIIGADQREYGPYTTDQVETWIRQIRANSQTLARLETETDWKPLGVFPEFAPVFATTPPPLVPSVDLRKSRIAAGLMGVFLGGLGIHRFYLGYIGLGIAEIIVTIVTCGIGHVWGFIEGILILAGTTITTDAEGKPLKD